MRALITKYIKPVHAHPKKMWWEWQAPFDPMLATLEAHEHGIVRHISAEAVTRNGLVLDYSGAGASNWRVA
jgi:hypothetical protein